MKYLTLVDDIVHTYNLTTPVDNRFRGRLEIDNGSDCLCFRDTVTRDGIFKFLSMRCYVIDKRSVPLHTIETKKFKNREIRTGTGIRIQNGRNF